MVKCQSKLNMVTRVTRKSKKDETRLEKNRRKQYLRLPVYHWSHAKQSNLLLSGHKRTCPVFEDF